LIGNVELHHGELSHDPPVVRLEIIGAELSMGLVNVLQEFGYIITDQSEQRVIAQKGGA